MVAYLIQYKTYSLKGMKLDANLIKAYLYYSLSNW